VLDTHVWKAYVEGASLSAKVVKRLDGARVRGELAIAAITAWEIAMLAAKGNIKLNGPTGAWVSGAIQAAASWCTRSGRPSPLPDS
jgi:PIN domain nuclease of toxin-antitoxin system